MSYSISTLLIRNLHDVFGENDPARRRAAIDEIFTEDCVFYDPSKGVYRGRDEIDRVAGAIKATHPDFRYQPITEPEESGNGGRVRWVSGRPVRRQLTPGPISSLPGTAGLPPFISFSTSYPESGLCRATSRSCARGVWRVARPRFSIKSAIISPLSAICLAAKSRQGLEKQTRSLLPITYYHCVFTLPAELDSLMLANQRRLYPVFFECAAQSLLEVWV